MISEVKHHYGDRVHVIDDKCLNTVLTQLCLAETKQPLINEFVTRLYSSLIEIVLDHEFPHKKVRVETRMSAKHPKARLETEVLDREQKTVSVNLARAGTLPSHVCYTFINYVLNPDLVRQDHITAARKTNEKNQVVGTSLAGSKIGGDVKDTIVIFPDPMGATGGTIISAMDHYKKEVGGKAKKFIAIHLIVTPEYLKKVLKAHKDLIVYTLRVDRGLSSADVLKTELGKKWDQEKGLDENHYIVPGAGGVGELFEQFICMKKKTKKPSLGKQGEALTKALKKASTPPLFIAMGSDSFIFYSDLVRKVELDIHCEFVTQSNLTSVGTLDVKNKNTVLVFAKKPAAAAQTSLKKLFMSAGASNVLVVSK